MTFESKIFSRRSGIVIFVENSTHATYSSFAKVFGNTQRLETLYFDSRAFYLSYPSIYGKLRDCEFSVYLRTTRTKSSHLPFFSQTYFIVGSFQGFSNVPTKGRVVL